MTRLPPPLRFLVAVVGLWTCLRAALLAPAWWPIQAERAAAEPPAAGAPSASEMPRARAAPPRSARSFESTGTRPPQTGPAGLARVRLAAAIPEERTEPGPESTPLHGRLLLSAAAPAGERDSPLSPPALTVPSAARSWALSAWTFWRSGGGGSLASGGALGGSQAGARATYRVAPALDLSFRLTAPMRRRAGAEAALGVDWKPSSRFPIRLLAERRQAVGREGRSAFGATAYGGIDDLALGRLRIDGYAQAGLVGLRRRDGFVDGAARLSLPLGRLKLGAGMWAAAQPGVARFDAGPQAALRLRLGMAAVTVAADWRIRLAGKARPGSGPALTLATGF